MDIYEEIMQNKENINTNYQKDSFYENYSINNNYIISNNIDNKNYSFYPENKVKNTKKVNKLQFFYKNNYSNDNEDLDIELNCISQVIPLENFYYTQNNNNEKVKENAKSKIKRKRKANSILNNIPTISEIYNSQNSQEKILSNNINNNINNNITIYNNTNSSINDTSMNKSIKRHNTTMVQNTKKFINKEKISNENIDIKNNRQLLDEIAKLKKENQKLILKNKELSLKLRTQEAKSKINSHQNDNINKKKLFEQKEEYYLQKIRNLESELIKQKDLVIKLSYHKRFNIGIRKLRISSFVIKGNSNKENNRIKRRNSVDMFIKNNSMLHYNNTLPDKTNKCKKRKNTVNSIESSIKTYREEFDRIIERPLLSSTHSTQKSIDNNINKKYNINNKKLKEYNKINISMNNSISRIGNHNRDNSIEIKLEANNNKSKIKNIKNINNIDKSIVVDMKKNKKNKNNKIKGKTNLIMTVINDNLLGNLNYNDYINGNFLNLYNKSIKNSDRRKNK